MYEYVGPPLNREALAKLLAANGVAERAYHLYGAHRDDALVLDHRPEGWVVFYSERGEEEVLARYDTEAEACLDLLTRLLADEHNRYELVAGPAPPEEADAAFDSWLRDHGLTREDLSHYDFKSDDVPWKVGDPDYRRYFIHRKRVRRPG
jgi:hypothetical protein